MPTPQSTQQCKPKTEPAQPWRDAGIWPHQNAQVKEHSITYGFRKGTKMSVEGSAGSGKMTIVYDTGDTK